MTIDQAEKISNQLTAAVLRPCPFCQEETAQTFSKKTGEWTCLKCQRINKKAA